MFQYIALLSILLFLLYIFNPRALAKTSNTSKFAYFSSCGLLMLLSALKASTVGNDTPEYVRIFEISPDLEFGLSRYEYGYILYNKLLYNISSSPQIVFICTSLFVFAGFSRFFWKYSEMPWLSVLFFFLMGKYAFVMSALRQSIALTILLFAFESLYYKKYFLFIAFTLFASTFHGSALLFLICLPLSFIKLNPRFIFLFILTSIISLTLFGDILDVALSYVTAYQRYVDGVYFEGETRVASLLQLSLSVIILFIGYSSFKKQKGINSYMVILHIVAVYLYVLCLKVNLIDRFAEYFSVFSLVFLPNAINKMHIDRKRITIYTFILYYSIYVGIALVYRPNWNNIYPYNFFWEEKERLDYIDRD